ncbi:hypothetical protein K1F50_09565 [Muricauda oceani]|uniref:Uncharacterized protein n=1 Tax=Flagellimonas oceani TaxID=2698672 RepID=A0A6G7J7I6_9FLAO|nr:hypothetical protein [Allomuricauda oceani]MBW8243046.1 hypothetical protein [Allomuricauda oceani]QII46599.1 hypothetical protein GVT53_18570 [Allomuricauda oceani]
MIDFVKIKVVECDIDKLTNHPYLEFHRTVSEKTGELGKFMVASYHKCKIKVYDSGTIFFSGSIHKMHNSIKGIEAPNRDPKGFNGNDFYFQDIIEIREHICSLFNVTPECLVLQNIELGLNLNSIFNPQDFIKWLLLFEGNEFEFHFDGLYAQSIHQQYIIKIYNKGRQYAMQTNTLRFEIKVLKMQHQLNHVGFRTMADIGPNVIGLAFDYLIKQLQKVLYYDITIQMKGLQDKQKSKLKDFKNPRYWSGLTPKKRHRDRKKLNILIESKSKNLKSELALLVNKKREQFNQLSETPFVEQFNHSNIGLNNTPLKNRICPVTGIDISMQKEGSKLLSNTGLKHLEKTNLKEFKRLQSILLTGEYNKFERTVYDMMSKQIRNYFYSKRDFYSDPILFN